MNDASYIEDNFLNTSVRGDSISTTVKDNINLLSIVARVSPDFQIKKGQIYYKLVVKRNGFSKITTHHTYDEFKRTD